MKLPQEFSERMKILLGEEYEEFLKTYEEPRRYGLRVNTLKIDAQEFEKIAPFPVRKLPWIPGGYWYEKCGTESVGEAAEEQAALSKEEDGLAEPSRHPFYYAGLYYLQEPSAMTPANVLPVEPGERVLDLCAAPGGKATALAAKLKGKGLLVANDISASRAKALLKNLEVFGVTNAFVTNAVPAKLAGQFPLFFDKILVDAPCSGEGMFRKDAANARAWSLEKVEACAKVQRGLLGAAVAMLRPGGMLLYSTCTFAPEEDEQAAAYLLREFPEMELCDIPWYEGFSHGRPELGRESWRESVTGKNKVNGSEPEESWNDTARNEEMSCREQIGIQKDREICEEENFRNEQTSQAADDRILAQLSRCVRIFPHKMRGEGHFLALFRKREQGGKNKKDVSPAKKAPSRAEWEILQEFLRDVRTDFRREQIEVRNSQVYLVPEELPVVQGIPFLRNGLYMGEIRRDRFEPSQSLAMALRKDSYASVIALSPDDERVYRYLKGETIGTDDIMPARAGGWQLVCVDDYPLGWGKLTNGTLKNKYHSGWRM